MRIPVILSKYLGKNFLLGVGIVMVVLSALIIMFDTLEMLRRSHSKEIPLTIIIQMVLLKLPTMLQEIMPFAVLLGGILSFARMTKTSELVVARAAGVSAWQFLAPALIISFTVGAFITTVFNPLSATMLSKYEQVEAKYLHGSTSMLSVSSTGLWLRQTNDKDGSKTVIHALRVSSSNMEIFDVTVYMFNKNGRFAQRIDAPSAKLHQGYWYIKDGTLTKPDDLKGKKSSYKIETNLSIHQIQESFASPETLSFWALPGFIKTLQEAGFSALRHSLYWHRVLVTPFLLSAMVLFAAAFSLRPPRQGRTGALIAGGIFTGFIIRFFSDLISAVGLSGSIPIILAAWAPVGISLLIGAVLILHLEDG